MTNIRRCPFTIYVDSAECHPYEFKGIRDDAVHDYALLTTQIVRASLGRHPNSFGDYTLEGGVGRCCIERKSMEDCWGTLLGWPTGWEVDRGLPGRRDRFEKELDNLNRVDAALIIVEANFGDCISKCPQWGVKPAEENAKIFFAQLSRISNGFNVYRGSLLKTGDLLKLSRFAGCTAST